MPCLEGCWQHLNEFSDRTFHRVQDLLTTAIMAGMAISSAQWLSGDGEKWLLADLFDPPGIWLVYLWLIIGITIVGLLLLIVPGIETGERGYTVWSPGLSPDTTNMRGWIEQRWKLPMIFFYWFLNSWWLFFLIGGLGMFRQCRCAAGKSARVPFVG